jgi:ribosome biogenesis protein Nip4
MRRRLGYPGYISYLYGMSEAERLIKKYGRDNASFMICDSETNDCVVRAVANAFEVDYIDAHRFCELKLHRVAMKGTYTGRYLHLITQAFGKKIKKMGKKSTYSHYRYLTRIQKTKVEKWSNAKQKYVTKRVEKNVPYKVKDFVKAFPQGNYIITVKSHAFALIDGVIKGNYDDALKINKRVDAAYKVS